MNRIASFLSMLLLALATTAAAADCPTGGPFAMALVLPAQVAGDVLEPGDVLRAYDADGRCVGQLKEPYAGANDAISVWGDDWMAEGKRGLADGERWHLARLRGGDRMWLADVTVHLQDETPYEGGYAHHAPPLLITSLAPDSVYLELAEAIAELEALVEAQADHVGQLSAQLAAEREKTYRQAQTITQMQEQAQATLEAVHRMIDRLEVRQ